MDRNDLIAIGQRTMAEIHSGVPKEDVKYWIIRTTSGTTGARPLVMALEYSVAQFRFFDDSCGIIICMGALNARLLNVRAARYAKKNLCKRVIAVDGKDLNQHIGKMLDDIKPDCFRGLPHFVGRVISLLSSNVQEEVRNLILTGERLSESRRDFLSALAPNATIQMAYATSELGPISKPPCPYTKLNQYHPAIGVRIEIDEPDKTGAGRLLISKEISGEKVENYAIGDIARFLPSCKCGESVTFEVLGRAGFDYVEAGGAILRKEEFDRVMQLFPYIEDYRVEVCELPVTSGFKVLIAVRCYRRGAPITEELKKEIARRFAAELYVTQRQTLSDLMQKNIFLSPQFEFFNTLPPKGHKEVKLVQRYV